MASLVSALLAHFMEHRIARLGMSISCKNICTIHKVSHIKDFNATIPSESFFINTGISDMSSDIVEKMLTEVGVLAIESLTEKPPSRRQIHEK